MHQQDDEVDHVVPGQEVVEACACGKQQQLHKKLSQQIYTDQREEPIMLWPRAVNELTAGQGPGQRHEEVSHIVGMANHAPPARHKQTFPCGRRDGLQICSGAAQDTERCGSTPQTRVQHICRQLQLQAGVRMLRVPLQLYEGSSKHGSGLENSHI